MSQPDKYHVDPISGNDNTGDGTKQNPFKTIAKAKTLWDSENDMIKEKMGSEWYLVWKWKANRQIQYSYRDEGAGYSLQGDSDGALINTYKENNNGQLPENGIDTYLDSL